MLRLALLRHAKSSWDDPGLDDFDRPLNHRGRHAAPVIGQMLASLKFEPEVILCSPARRTRETLDCIRPFMTSDGSAATFDRALYLAGASELLDRIRKVQPPAAAVLVIGHNPGLHSLAAWLATSGDPVLMSRLGEKFPTAALALLSFPQAAWDVVDPKTGHLDAFITPKDRA